MDPWEWTVDDLVSNVCHSNKIWADISTTTLPNLTTLENAIKENEVDGCAFLTHVTFDSLKSELGIKSFSHRSAITLAVESLQGRSRGWKAQQASNHVKDREVKDLSRVRSPEATPPSSNEQLHPVGLSNEAPTTTVNNLHHRDPRENRSTFARQGEVLVESREGGRKRRKILPQAAEPVRPGKTLEQSSLHGYLGTHKLSPNSIMFGDAKDGDALTTDSSEDQSENSIILVNSDSSMEDVGRISYISRRVKGLLRAEPEKISPNSMQVQLYPQHLAAEGASTLRAKLTDERKVVLTRQSASYPSSEPLNAEFAGQGTSSEWDFLAEKYSRPGVNEDVLPLYGESDDGDNDVPPSLVAEWEDEIREEQMGKTTFLTSEQVISAINESIESFRHHWTERKLPKLEMKRHSVWRKAQRGGRRQWLESLKVELARKFAYLAKLKDRMLEQKDWTSESQVVTRCKILDQTIMNICELEWTQMVQQGPKPALVERRIAPTPKKPEGRRKKGKDDDDLSIDSEFSDMDEFIADDQDPVGQAQHLSGDIFKDRSPTPQKTLPAPNQDSYRDVNEIDSVLGEHTVEDSKGRVTSPLHQLSQDSVLGDSSDDNKKSSDSTTKTKIPNDVEVIDLTEAPSSPLAPTETGPNIDLTLPNPTPQISFTPPENSMREAIESWDMEMLEEIQDRKRLVLKLLCQTDLKRFLNLQELVNKFSKNEYKNQLRQALVTLQGKNVLMVRSPNDYEGYITLARLFVCWVECDARHLDESTATAEGIVAARRNNTYATNVTTFYEFLKNVLDEEEGAVTFARENSVENLEDPARRVKHRKPKKRRAGQDLRESARRRHEAGVEGRERILLKLSSSGLSEVGVGGVVINPFKDYEHDHIYIDKSISNILKPHQREGVQFLWREAVSAGLNGPSGCLLSHTMGLGKTLQTITLLFTLIQYTTPSTPQPIIDQIPSQLRPDGDTRFPRILIVSPAGLIMNWVDEFSKWIPEGHPFKSSVLTVDSSKDVASRHITIDAWYADGGVLIIGYELLQAYLTDEKPDSRVERSQSMLKNGPGIVVADEAHKLKNPTSGASVAMRKIQAHSRIALTGSPLANNLGEYYQLIDWVAPKYLGEIEEFRQEFQLPIEDGTYADSTRYEQRRSTKKLQALKEELEPKVNRKDTSAIRVDLPSKTEFVIRVGLTSLQKRAYTLLVQSITTAENQGISNTRLFAYMSLLALLCFHSSAFLKKLFERETKASKKLAKKSTKEQEDFEDEDTAARNIPTPVVLEQQALFDSFGEMERSQSAKCEIIEKIVLDARARGESVLIFSHLLAVHEHLDARLKQLIPPHLIARIQGDTATATRPRLCKEFNATEFQVMLVSTKAGGLGLNLHGASRVILVDFGWNPSWEEQAVGRAYRLGQQKPVFVYHLITAGTFEEPLHHRTVFKKQLALRAVDKKNMKPVASKIKDFLFAAKDVEKQDLSGFKGQDDILDGLLQGENSFGIMAMDTTDIMHQRDEELSPEELNEVKQIREDNRIRLENPMMWKGRKLARDQEDLARQRQFLAKPEMADIWGSLSPSAMLAKQGLANWQPPLLPSEYEHQNGKARQVQGKVERPESHANEDVRNESATNGESSSGASPAPVKEMG